MDTTLGEIDLDEMYEPEEVSEKSEVKPFNPIAYAVAPMRRGQLPI